MDLPPATSTQDLIGIRMNHEERFAQLERELNDLSQRFKLAGGIIEHFMGQQAMYMVALDSLIVSHPFPPALRPVLSGLTARAEAHTVAEIQSEDYLSGLQEAQERIMVHLAEAERLHQLTDDPENQTPEPHH